MTEPSRKTPASRSSAAKKKAPAKSKSKAPAKSGGRRRRPPARKPWEPANAEDLAAVNAALEKALIAKEKNEPLTPERRAHRDGAIVAAVIGRGLRVVTVAEQVGLSEEQVRRILHTYRENRLRQAFPDSMSLLFDALDALDSNIEEAADLAASDDDSVGAGVRLGAMRLRRDLQADRLQVLIHMGIVRPDAHNQVRAAEFRRRLEAGLRALRDAGVTDEQLTAMRIAMEAAAGGGEVITLGEARSA
jgi:hypothetical protein